MWHRWRVQRQLIILCLHSYGAILPSAEVSTCHPCAPRGTHLCPLQNWAVSEPLPLLACCNSVVKFPTFARCVGINTLVFHSILILFKLISDIQRWKETRNTCWWLEYLLFWSNRWTGEYFKVKIWLKVVLCYSWHLSVTTVRTFLNVLFYQAKCVTGTAPGTSPMSTGSWE